MSDSTTDTNPADTNKADTKPADTPAEPARDAHGGAGSDRKGVVQGSLLTGGVIVVLLLWAMVNYLGMRHYERFDWTGADLYTLSEKSEKVVENLEEEIEIVVLLDQGSELYTQVDELVDRYVAANPQKIARRDLDRAKDLLEFQQLVADLGIDRANVVVVRSGDDKRLIEEYELVEYDYAGGMGRAPEIAEFKGEKELTSAILSLVEAEKPKVVFTQGHGEIPFDAAAGGGRDRSLREARRLLGEDNFDLETWTSTGGGDVPPGTDLLVISAPASRFPEPELDAVERYLDAGGRLLVFLEPSFRPGSEELVDVGLSELLESYGIAVRNDVVVDPGSTYAFYGPDTIYTDRYGDHPIVEALDKTRTPVLMSGVSSLQITGDAATEAVALVRSSDEAWGETDLGGETAVEPGEGDAEGSLPLAVAAWWTPGGDGGDEAEDAEEAETADDTPEGTEGDVEEAAGEPTPDEARILVFGDLDFATDGLIGQGANSLLVLNAFNWVTEREALVEIEGRKPESTKLSMSNAELFSLYGVVVLLMPASALFLGLWIALRRRR